MPTTREQLEMDRDTVLEYIETVNALIYENQIEIEKLEKLEREYYS